jgi:YfiH family protein
VAENRARVARAFGLGVERLCTLRQVHGREVVTVTATLATRPEADAMVTKTPGLMLGILTADCAPVLLADAEAGVIGALHAGWKGAFAGVAQATVERMERLGARAARIQAAIGPTIAQSSYEVDAAFRARILEHAPEAAAFFRASAREAHHLFDLKAYVGLQLRQSGVASINALENDTYIEEDDFFSFRRATHRREPDYGRQISVIALSSHS